MRPFLPDTVDTVIWAPDDGWRYHPKHVEQFADINKLYIVASCRIIIDILRDTRTIEHKIHLNTLVPFSLPLGLQISFKSSEYNMQTLLTSHPHIMRIQPVVFSFVWSQLSSEDCTLWSATQQQFGQMNNIEPWMSLSVFEFAMKNVMAKLSCVIYF